MNYSVIIPASDQSIFLEEAIDSVLSQHLVASQILIAVDSGSKEQFSQISDLVRTHESLTIIESEGKGMIAALNAGIKASSSPFTAFLDSDDLWLPSKQSEQIDILDKNPECDVVTGLAANFDGDDPYSRRNASWRPALMFTSATFRTDCFTRFGALDETCSHFTWLYRWWTNANARGIARYTQNSPCVLRRIHGDNSWKRNNLEAHNALFSELRKIINRPVTEMR